MDEEALVTEYKQLADQVNEALGDGYEGAMMVFAMDFGAVVNLLVEKGVFTKAEYMTMSVRMLRELVAVIAKGENKP